MAARQEAAQLLRRGRTPGIGRTKLAWLVTAGGNRRSFCAEGAHRGRWREVGSHSNVHQGFELRI